MQVIPGDCDSTGAEAYRLPPDDDGDPTRDRIRVVIRTCCCCDSTYTPLGLLRSSGSTPGGGVSVRTPPTPPLPEIVPPTTPEAPPEFADRMPVPPIGPRPPFTPLTFANPGGVPTPTASVRPAVNVPWWLGLLALPAGLFVIERMPEGTICDDSGPAVGPNRPSCDLPPRRAPRA